MADDDLDLDAMLDSALDEGFADASNTAEAQPEPEELDLDSMLDDALDSTAASTMATRSQGTNGSGTSQHRLLRKQDGRNATRAPATKEPWPFLTGERREVWKATIEVDGKRQVDMEKQRPLSRAYRSFYRGKEDGAVVVHLGSGAVAASASAAANGDDTLEEAIRTGDDREGAREGAANIFEEVFSKCVSNSGVKEPPTVKEGDYEEFDRLRASYLRLVAKDVRARVSNDPDVDPDRFPSIFFKILA